MRHLSTRLIHTTALIVATCLVYSPSTFAQTTSLNEVVEARPPQSVDQLKRILQRSEEPDAIEAALNELTVRASTESEASYVLASLYYNGSKNVPRDLEKAIAAIQVAVEGGDTAAISRLGDIYRRANNAAMAVEYYTKSANSGDTSSAVRLADYLRAGAPGVPINRETAKAYYELAAKGGDRTAELKLAAGILDGSLLGEQAGALDTLRRAAADQVEGANVALGRAYLTVGDTALAIEVLQDAVDNGDADAGRVLLRLYVEGRKGFPADLPAAKAVLQQIESTIDSTSLAFESLIIDVADRPTPGSYVDILDVFNRLPNSAKANAISRSFRLNQNAYVLFIQEQLSGLGYYRGNKNGLLNSSTISAFNAACNDFNIVQDCQTGPLSYSARQAVQKVLFNQS